MSAGRRAEEPVRSGRSSGRFSVVFSNRLTDAVFAADVRLVTDVADAAVASPQVLADAVLADVGVQRALVDV